MGKSDKMITMFYEVIDASWENYEKYRNNESKAEQAKLQLEGMLYALDFMVKEGGVKLSAEELDGSIQERDSFDGVLRASGAPSFAWISLYSGQYAGVIDRIGDNPTADDLSEAKSRIVGAINEVLAIAKKDGFPFREKQIRSIFDLGKKKFDTKKPLNKQRVYIVEKTNQNEDEKQS